MTTHILIAKHRVLLHITVYNRVVLSILMIMHRFFNIWADRFSRDIAIDLGSTNTLIYLKGNGVVVNEPSVIAFQKDSRGQRQVIGVGAGVRKLHGRHSKDIAVIKPIKYGAIADFTAAREMLRCYLSLIRRKVLPTALRVIAPVPARATEHEKDVVQAVIKSAGAREVYLIEESRALALGAGLDIADEKGLMVIDIGGGITEMAVLVNGRVVCAQSALIGGEDMDKAIAGHLMARHNLRVDDHTAEMIKVHIGKAYPDTDKRSIEVKGMNCSANEPACVEVNSHEVSDALSRPINTVITIVKNFLKTLPPELYVNVLDRGILLAGGGAMLRNMDRLLEREILMPVVMSPDPLSGTVRGSGDALDYLKIFHHAE
jgi:rod shape-determining protein MreB and related proteins